MIRVLLVDDQDLMLQGLSMIVGKTEGMEVVGQCRNGQEAVEFVKKSEVDIVLMDIRMPNMNGVDATKAIKELNDQIRIIILTTFNDDDYIFSSLKFGASGYLLKDATPDEITDGIKKVYQGGTLINADVATKVVSVINSTDMIHTTLDDEPEIELELTKREFDICHLLASGMNNKEIGSELMISEGTVKNNITRILDKLDLRDRTQLALFSMKHRL